MCVPFAFGRHRTKLQEHKICNGSLLLHCRVQQLEIGNIISKFEADIQVPLHKAEYYDWRKGSQSLANRGEMQLKVENLATGHQRVGR